MESHYTNPYDEALDISLEIRRKLLEGKEDIVSVLRNCLVVANNLSKKEDLSWIRDEIEGSFDSIPSYRKVGCFDKKTKEIRRVLVPFEIKLLVDFSSKGEEIHWGDEQITVRPVDSKRIIDRVTNKCLFFLNDCVSELQYGGYTQSFFEKIRKEVEPRLSSLDERIPQELQSLYLNLASKNPADYSKVALSCRKIIKIVADRVFPASDQKYKTKDGREWEVKDSNFRNRLLCFIDKNSGNRIVKSELEMMEKYMHDVTADTQGGVHQDLTNYEASMIALHTYIVLSEVLSKIK